MRNGRLTPGKSDTSGRGKRGISAGRVTEVSALAAVCAAAEQGSVRSRARAIARDFTNTV
jgi:hypothetical protein